jgi:hypothetical protein
MPIMPGKGMVYNSKGRFSGSEKRMQDSTLCPIWICTRFHDLSSTKKTCLVFGTWKRHPMVRFYSKIWKTWTVTLKHVKLYNNTVKMWGTSRTVIRLPNQQVKPFAQFQLEVQPGLRRGEIGSGQHPCLRICPCPA